MSEIKFKSKAKPKWQTVFDSVCLDIKAEKFRAGNPFHTVKELSQIYNVSNITSRRVFQELKTRDMIETNGRQGTTITPKKQKQKVFLCLRSEVFHTSDSVMDTGTYPFYHELSEGFKNKGMGDCFEIVQISVNLLQSHPEDFKGRDIIVSGSVLLNVEDKVDKSINQQMVEYLEKEFNPIILHGFDGISENMTQVESDSYHGFHTATCFLAKKGYKRIGFLSGQTHSVWNYPKFKGYSDALYECGLDFFPQLFKVVSREDHHGDLAAIKELLEGPDKPDSVICAHDVIALHVIEYCKKKNISIPGELAVVGFGNHHESSYCKPSLTSLDRKVSDMAYTVLNLLKQRKNGKLKAPVRIKIKPELIIRESA